MTLADVQIRDAMNAVLDEAKARLAAKELSYERALEDQDARYILRSEALDKTTGQIVHIVLAIVVSENREAATQMYRSLKAGGGY